MSNLLEIRPFLTFGKPSISELEIQAVTDVLRSGWVGTGKVSTEFEEEFAKYMGGGYAVAVSSCSIGLAIALKACGIGPRDDVMTSPLTFASTVNAILMVGARPIFVDVDESGCLDYRQILKFKTERLAALLPIHYTGASVNMRPLVETAKKLGLRVIEDAAHSFGGSYFNLKQGSMGDLGVFSFYATKNITSGEGGMIFTKDSSLAEKCRILSQNGQSQGAWGRYAGPVKKYEVLTPGFKGNLPDVLAAIGLVQIQRWDELKEARERIWKIYEEAFGKKEEGHSRHLYTIQVDKRDELRNFLFEKGIGTGVHYEPLHLEPGYKFLGYKKGDLPKAEKIGRKTLSLPVSNSMTEEEAHYVVRSVHDFH